MAKKPKNPQIADSNIVSSVAADSSSANGVSAERIVEAPAKEPSLVICRNKHWRYISTYHGPWLQMRPDTLDEMALSNARGVSPCPIDPAIFFDIARIRRLIEDATTAAVRANNGTTALNDTLSAGLGGSNAASAKLSKERKRRMREQATQKLSEAYHLDELAASVGSMQSTSSLEDVAKHVLQKDPCDVDARYVHFFHEKIPSRMIAQHTSLEPLDDAISERPNDPAFLRTRAVTKMFVNDYLGAIRDLTDALAICRYTAAQHYPDLSQMQLTGQKNNDHKNRYKATGMEQQLLFHRAGVNLTLACENINDALGSGDAVEPGAASQTLSPAVLEARKNIRAYAKRALRDYMDFLSHFSYTPGVSTPAIEASLDRLCKSARSAEKVPKPDGYQGSPPLEMSGNHDLSFGGLSDALVPIEPVGQEKKETRREIERFPNTEFGDELQAPKVYLISSLFSAGTPQCQPSRPPAVTQSSLRQAIADPTVDPIVQRLLAFAERQEVLTFHPLLADALHSVLICHCLMHTSKKELLRHAEMVARLCRVSDGYPIFLIARSTSRADWKEILRRTDNWIGLEQSWETLCSPIKPADKANASGGGSPEEAKKLLEKAAAMRTLSLNRVQKHDAIDVAIHARERRADIANRKTLAAGPPSWVQDMKDMPLSTERAEALARWINESPQLPVKPAHPKRPQRQRAVSMAGDQATA